jgi:hypothetical protein
MTVSGSVFPVGFMRFGGENVPEKIEKRPLVILESPFAGKDMAERAENVEYAKACLRDSIFQHGESPIASHVLYNFPVTDDDIPTERAQGIAAGLAWGRVADKTVCYIDRGYSRGVAYGIKSAMEEGRPVEVRSLEHPEQNHIANAEELKRIREPFNLFA